MLSNQLKNDAQSTNSRLNVYHICTRTIEKLWIRRDRDKEIERRRKKHSTTHTFCLQLLCSRSTVCTGYTYSINQKYNLWHEVRPWYKRRDMRRKSSTERHWTEKYIYITNDDAHTISNLIIILFFYASSLCCCFISFFFVYNSSLVHRISCKFSLISASHIIHTIFSFSLLK